MHIKITLLLFCRFTMIIIISGAVHCRYPVPANNNPLQVQFVPQPLEKRPRSRVKDKDGNETHRAPVSAILSLPRKMCVDASL